MLNRQVAPAFHEPSYLALPEPLVKYVGDIPVYFVQGVQQRVLKLELIFDAGRTFEHKAGTSHFAWQMLSKGTAGKTATEVAEIFDRLGAHVETTTGQDYSTLALYALTKNWKEALNLFLEIATQPAFPEDELALLKALSIDQLRVNLEKTSFVASRRFRENIFGADHPYGKSLNETEINSIVTADLTAFFKAVGRPLVIYVTAQLDETEQKNFLSQLPFKNRFTETVVTASAHLPEASIAIDKKGSVQTSLRLGKKSLVRSDAQYPDLLFLTHVLGGYFGSRLMKNIREEKGLTYGIYAALQPFKHEGIFVIGADVNKENTVLAIEEIRKELKMLRTAELQPDELRAARGHFLGSLQAEVANPFAVTEKIKNIHLHNLPADYYKTLFERVQQLTPHDLMQTAATYLHEDSLNVVTVG